MNMLTRAQRGRIQGLRERIQGLHDFYQGERERRSGRYSSDSAPSGTGSKGSGARAMRVAERAAIRERNKWSYRRILRPGEVKRIVELRFGRVGNVQTPVPTHSYRFIGRRLLINRLTVQSVCRAYV